MTIIDQPLSLSLLGNIKPFKIGSTETVTFVLKKGAETIIQETYNPGTSGVVNIDVKDVLEGYLSYLFTQIADTYIQPNIAADFTATISGTDITFRVIRAGVDMLADTPANFLKANFLTWQPQIKPVTYSSPEFLTYYAVVACSAVLEATMPDNSKQTITLINMTAGNAYTIPAQYAAISAKLNNALPKYYDIYVKDADGNRLSYIQRYYPAAMQSEEEQWILFENSLGGLDCFRAYGQTDFTGEHTHNIAEIDEVAEEYRVDTERKFKKNTGYLDLYDRKWLLDYFPSKKKYIYTGSSVRQIVVTESNVTYSDKELPSNYDFTYKYADAKPFLNIERTNTLPTDITITMPDASSFTVPPRLIDFPRLSMTEGALFPVQSPYSETWGTTTAGALAEFFKTYIGTSSSGSGDVGHTHINKALLDVLTFVDGYLKVNGSKVNAGYADKAGSVDGLDDKYISKINEDTAQKILHLLEGATFGDKCSIDGNGNARLKSLILDSFLEAPEMRYNRVYVSVGHDWKTNGAGIVESVTINEDGVSGTVKLKLEKGEAGAVAVDDLCMGIWHDEIDETNNNTVTSDDGIGNYCFAGFGTSYFRITSITSPSDNSEFTYTMRPVSANYSKMIHPKPGMHFAQFTNPTDVSRQNSRYSTTTYERYLTGLTTWEYSKVNIAMQFGDCSNLSVFGLNMADKSAYLRNIYMSGTIQQLEELPAKMNIDNDGDGFLAWGEETNIKLTITKGFEDITASMVTWRVTRDSGDAVNDNAWNIAHLDFNGNIVIAFKNGQNDLGVSPDSSLRTMFTFYASDQAGTEIEQPLII